MGNIRTSLRRLVPERLKDFIPKPTFLSIHYTYIIGLTIISSVVIYGERNFPYIDALFFASGAATQSGLNTIDLNLIKLYQQIVLYIVPLITGPIFIHSAIVFFRIYKFEKRFESIVQDSRLNRWGSHTIARSVAEGDPDSQERGVAGRPITVLHGSAPSSLINRGPPASEVVTQGVISNEKVSTGGSASDSSGRQSPQSSGPDSTEPSSFSTDNGKHLQLARALNENGLMSKTNGNGVTDPEDVEAKGKTVGTGPSSHIAFADNRDPPKKQTGVLRIPSPREFERGGKVEDIEAENSVPLRRSATVGEVPVSEESSGFGFGARKRMGSITGRLMPRSQTMLAITSGFSRHRSSSPHSRLSKRMSRQEQQERPYLSYTPTVGRNSAFVDLTDEQKEELGGLEYRALKLLAKILVGYYLFFYIFGVVCVLPWINRSPYYEEIVLSSGNNPSWWAFFTTSSAFMDLGYTITADSMVSFQKATWPIIVLIFLIVIGNTGFPCMLRFIIWGMKKLVPEGSSMDAPLGYLLDHPRRCFTLLFPSSATWALFGILAILNALDLILFISLDLNAPVVENIPTGYRVLAGLFQATSTRTAGLAIVNLADLHPAIQVSYMVMMYISVFPIAMTIRGTNVYEESALGIYAAEETPDGNFAAFIGTHFRNQLQYDLWYIFLGLFIIACVEGNRIKDDNAFSLFSILFEVVSAYGTVGLSLGYPNYNSSFSGQFHTVSKLVIIAMEIRGRHRGLPYQVDRAILLPSDALLADQRLQRRPSLISTHTGVPLGRTLSQVTGRFTRPSTATKPTSVPTMTNDHVD